MRIRALISALFAFATFCSFASAEIYKCKDRYSSSPCEDGQLMAGTANSEESPVNVKGKADNTPSAQPARTEKCAAGQIFISTRRPPRGEWGKREKLLGDFRNEVVLKGRLFGQGKVSAEIVGTTPDSSKKKILTSKTLRFPDEGGEKDFELRFIFTKGSWVLDLQNQGRFNGYCTTESHELVQAKRRAEEAEERSISAEALASKALAIAVENRND